MLPFSDLARAAYCPRQLYYARRDDRTVPPAAEERRRLAFRYPELRTASDGTLRDLPVDRPPGEYRAALDRLAARPDWDVLVAPAARSVLLEGKDCRGRVGKVLEPSEGDGGADATGSGGTERAGNGSDDPGAAPVPVLLSPGEPPENGVWEPQSVRAVAAAKALAWERERAVPRALVEYPAHGVVREVRLTTRRKATYRRILRTVRSMDGPPGRTADRGKCSSCDYREECGVRTVSLRSLLGR